MVGHTKDGFEVKVDERILNDWRFTMTVATIQSGSDMEKVVAAGNLVDLLLGEEGKKALMDHISAKNDGFIPAEDVMVSVTEIIDSCKETKN